MENKLNLYNKIKYSETSRGKGMYPEADGYDNLQICFEDRENLKQDKQKIVSVNEKLKGEDANWYIAIKDKYMYQGDIYNIDNDGNLIAKVDLVNFKTKLDDGSEIPLDDINKEKIRKILKTTKEQINFKEEQQKLKKEINGYPEYSEPALQIYNDNENTPLRLKREFSQLRALFPPDKITTLRILLSIVKINNLDYYNDLKQNYFFDKIFTIHDSSTKMVYECINNCIRATNKFPTLQCLLNILKLPYSKLFFEEYLLNEDELEYEIKEKFKLWKETVVYKQFLEKIKRQEVSPIQIKDGIEKYLNLGITPKIDNTFEQLKDYIENDVDDESLITGVKDLDNNNINLIKGKICSVFAYTGSFKTMFCTNVSYNNILNNKNVVYISLEISKQEMYINFLSRYSYELNKKISHSDVKMKKLSKKDKEYFLDTVLNGFKNKAKDNLIIYDETDITKNNYNVYYKLLYDAERNFMTHTGHGVDLVVIDHLNLLKFDNDNKIYNDYSAINHWMSYFRKNCVNFLGQNKKIAILCACQSSREGYKEACKNGKYRLTNIAEGNEIERSSQLVLSLYTSEEDYQNNQTHLQVLKYRDGKIPEDTIDINLAPQYYAFDVKTNNKKDNVGADKFFIKNKNDYSVFKEGD